MAFFGALRAKIVMTKIRDKMRFLNPCDYVLGFPLIWAALRPTHGSLPIDPLIDFPKGFSSKMTLEVAARRLKVFPCYKLKTRGYSQNNAFCTKIMSIVINLCTVCKALFDISVPQGTK